MVRKLNGAVIAGTVNSGACHARNALLQFATADLVHFHDADDSFSDPRFIASVGALTDRRTAAFYA